ncbi:MAG: hypothetical protein IIW02_00785 [Clostridia bacterium]|nr:hypothetical protein [Clostridia bacterium]
MFVCGICVVALLAGILAGHLLNKKKPVAEEKVMFESDFNFSQGGLITDAYDLNSGVTVFTYEEAGGMDDSRCLSIENKSANDARYVLKIEDALENTFYRASVWIKTENVGDGENQVGANISALNTGYHSYAYVGDQEWTLLEFFGMTGEGQTSFELCLRLGFYSGINVGKVWFDDLCVEQLSKLPAGVIANSMVNTMTSANEKDSSGRIKNERHDDTLAVGLIVLLVSIAVFAVCIKYAKNKDNIILSTGQRESRTNVELTVLILILCGFIVRLLGSVTLPQCDIDVNLFKYWARMTEEYGITEVYSHAEEINLDYPPLLMYWLGFVGKFCKLTGIGTGTAFGTVLIKLPSMIADCVIAFFIYKWCRNLRKANKNWILLAIALWLFNPLVLLDSTAWGQVDAFQSMFMVASVYWISQNKYALASGALAFAVALKPQGIMLVPVLGYALFKLLISKNNELPIIKRILVIARCVVIFTGIFFVIMLPFGIKMEPNIFVWIFKLYGGTVDGYEYATVNAFNFFFLINKNWAPDNEVVFNIGKIGVTLNHLGMLAIVAFAVLAWVLYQKANTRKPYIPFMIAATLIYGVVTFGPRMHERYFFPVIIFMLFAVILSNNKIMLGLFAVTTISNFFTVLEVMTGLSVGAEIGSSNYDAMAYFYWNHMNTERFIMALFNVLTCLTLTIITVLTVFNVIDIENKKFKIWKELPEYEEGAENE